MVLVVKFYNFRVMQMRKENWIKWDLNSRMGGKMSLFFHRHGHKGYGFFIVMTENLYLSDGYKIKVSDLPNFYEVMQIDANDANLLLHELVDLKLWKIENEFLFSERILEETSKISAARSEAAKARWDKNKSIQALSVDANGCKAMQKVNLHNLHFDDHAKHAKLLDKNRLDKNISNPPHNPPLGEILDLGEKKQKSKKQKKPIDKYFEFCEADFTFPEKWGAKSKQALKDWVDFKNQQGTAKLLISYQKEIDSFAKTPQRFFSLVYRAISKNWQGLNEHIPLNSEDGGTHETPSGKKYHVMTDSQGNEFEVELVGGFHLGKN